MTTGNAPESGDATAINRPGAASIPVERSGRPVSEVSDVTGLIGLAALLSSVVVAVAFDLSVLSSTLLILGGTALPMIVATLVFEKSHKRATTGLDLRINRPASEIIPITVTKTIGLGITFAIIGALYCTIETYSHDRYRLFLIFGVVTVSIVWFISPLYIYLTSKHMREPKDELWHFAKFVCLQHAVVDFDKVKAHCLAWAVKAFFLAFMVSVLPATVNGIINFDPLVIFASPVNCILFLVKVTFLADVCLGTLGYILTLRVLDSHIRSTNPFVFGWVAALICYPPFILMGHGGPLDYRIGTQEWIVWFHGHPTLLVLWGGAILGLSVVYAWATVVFGIRFSNLTHRGIITTGPFRFSRHPAYLSKNLMWWMVHLPFLSTASTGDAIQNCFLLLAVNAVYFARAKTEERHLMADPRYRAYSEWIAQHGLLAGLFSRLGISTSPTTDPHGSEQRLG